MSRLIPLFIFTAVLSTGCSQWRPGNTVSPDLQPNILLITADNLGYGDVGCYGNDDIQTPNIDRLASQGARCTDFYTASPTCTVSRASLLTGRYPQRTGLNHQLSPAENMGLGLRESERLIPHYLKELGYATGCFGKWNIGFAPNTRPTERGFDEFFGHASGNIDYYSHVYKGRLDTFRGVDSVRVEGYSTDLFADAAGEFIRRHADRPFFVYLPFNAPHFPDPRNKAPGQPTIWQAPPEAFAKYGLSPNEPDPKTRYRAVVTAMDAGLGRVLDQLDELDLARKTLVIFYSDNGAFMLKNKGLEVASNAPLRDGGVTLWEGGIRVPCVVRWPGKIEAGTVCAEPIISLDWFALALKVAGAPLPEDRVIDGRDPTPALTGTGATGHAALYFHFRKMDAIRRGRYKLLAPKSGQPDHLYDVVSDVGETENLAAAKPELVESLRQDFDAWMAGFGNAPPGNPGA